MEMSEKIKYLRIKNNLTLEQLGDKVGVGKSTVRKWECGLIANMRRDKIAKLAEALNTTPAYLMGWEEEAPTPSPQQQMVLETVQMLMDLTPQEVVQVTAFVAGLKAARAAAQSPQSSDPK